MAEFVDCVGDEPTLSCPASGILFLGFGIWTFIGHRGLVLGFSSPTVRIRRMRPKNEVAKPLLTELTGGANDPAAVEV